MNPKNKWKRVMNWMMTVLITQKMRLKKAALKNHFLEPHVFVRTVVQARVEASLMILGMGNRTAVSVPNHAIAQMVVRGRREILKKTQMTTRGTDVSVLLKNAQMKNR